MFYFIFPFVLGLFLFRGLETLERLEAIERLVGIATVLALLILSFALVIFV